MKQKKIVIIFQNLWIYPNEFFAGKAQRLLGTGFRDL
jgi:hypothetical protein